MNTFDIRIFSKKGLDKLTARKDVRLLSQWKNNLGSWWEVRFNIEPQKRFVTLNPDPYILALALSRTR